MKPILLIAESDDFGRQAIELVKERFEVRLADCDREELLASVDDVDILWVRLRNQIDQEVISRASKLKVIATNTTGLNHIDLEFAAQRKIQVVSLKGETKFLDSIRATAEHTLALTLALLRQVSEANQHVKEGKWSRDLFRGNEIFQKTVGIIGYGRLGKIVAGYFQALGAEVIVNSLGLTPGESVDGRAIVTPEQLWSMSDIVSLHANFEPGNDSMISRREFKLAKPTCVFINTARGELVDEASLVEAITKEHIAGAAIDVIRDEQTRDRGTHDVISLAAGNPRLLITPHIGGNTFESRIRTEEFLAQKLIELSLFGKKKTR